MAIQVSSTTVIDNSRNLNNIAGADATTVSNLQSAGLGASTTYGGVGTYSWGRPANGTTYNGGDTASGVYAMGLANSIDKVAYYNGSSATANNTPVALSGTWRCMSIAGKWATGYNYAHAGLWVRIS